MNSKTLFIGELLLAATTLSLAACGGSNENSITDLEVGQIERPTFSRLLARVSNAYSPTGDITEKKPTFTWKMTQGATDYIIGHEDANTALRWHYFVISKDKASCSTSSGCSYKPEDIAFATGDEKVWWVRPKIAGEWKEWSSPYVFNVVDITIPPMPASKPITPAGLINTATPTFKWTPGNGATQYQIGMENEDSTNWEIYTVTANQANCQSSSCSYQPANNKFVNGDKKTWWVRENRNGTWENWSDGSRFTVSLSNYIPFSNTSNVTSIVKINEKWYGIKDKDVLVDDGANTVAKIFTAPVNIDSTLSTAISGNLSFIATTSTTDRDIRKELHVINVATNEDKVLISTYDIDFENSNMNNFLLVSHSKRPARYTSKEYSKVDINSLVIKVGYSSEGSNRFRTTFAVESTDIQKNEIYVTITVRDSPLGRPATVTITKHKITDVAGVGLEDR